MRKAAVFALMLCLLPCFATTAHAEDSASPDTYAVIHLSVPSIHTLTVHCPEDVTILVNGQGGGANYEIDRLSEPEIDILIPDGMVVAAVTANGKDITSAVSDSKLKLEPVYEDIALDIVTKQETAVVTTVTTVITTTVSSGVVTTASTTAKPIGGSTKTGDSFPLGILLMILLTCTGVAIYTHPQKE